jgi:hypothetical protein
LSDGECFFGIRKPTRCHLWQSKKLTPAEVAGALELVQSFASENHLSKSLCQCKICGQLYFHVWFEVIDWDDGTDPMYDFYIPVTTQTEIERLKEAPPPPMSIELLEFLPRLQIGNSSAVTWAGQVATE